MSDRALIRELRHAADAIYGSASYWTGRGMAALLTRAADRLEVLGAGLSAYRQNWRSSNHSVEGCTEDCPDECTDDAWAAATDRVLAWEKELLALRSAAEDALRVVDRQIECGDLREGRDRT